MMTKQIDNEVEKKQRYASLDILKTVAAFMVCYQHSCGSGTLSGYLLAVSRIAVPLFVMITAFFYQDTCKNRHEGKQILRFIKIALEMFVIYFIVDLGSDFLCLIHRLRQGTLGICGLWFMY